MLRNLTFLLIFIICSIQTYAQQEKYSRVKVWTNEAGIIKLTALGIETDHGDIKKGVWLISDYSAAEIQKIQSAGFSTEILIDDIKEHYKTTNQLPAAGKTALQSGCTGSGAPVYPVPANFSLGSMGGYFTYQEMLDNLDSMSSKYPNLITIKAAIPGGTTIENRPVYYIKISDNPNIDETEPEMLYTAVHHAREPGGMSQLIYYMWYLLENYAGGGELTTLVDNTEMYFIPCINPDGYIYNETTDPNGGGMWRKNRKNNADGSVGVDLNRNYGYNWGFDDSGSSPSGFDETYRGTSSFSEPETQLVSGFVNSRNIRIALNYHTFGNLLIYPWGYDYSIYTPDSAIYADYGKLLTTYNAYTYGTADQTVGYIVNGSSDDWMYGEQTVKPKIFAMTPETGDGGFGFWPPQSEIIPICQLNMFQNITAAQLCGRFAKLEETSPALISQGGGYINYNLKQLGLDTTGTYTISLSAVSPNIILTGNPKSYSNLSPGQLLNDSISFGLTTPMTNGDPIIFLLSIDNGFFIKTDTIVKTFGNPVIAFSSDCNSTTGWNLSQWGISNSIFYSPSASIADSPGGNYSSNQYKSVTVSNSIDLTTAVFATLSFYARWEIETGYDYVQARASIDNGNTWTPLCGKYTVPGSLNQDPDMPLYEGFQQNWVKEEVSLNDYLGSNVLIGFLLASDGFIEFDGYYFDDVLVEKVLPGTNSINELQGSFSISLMPNPASEYVYINLNVPAIVNSSIAIRDVSGRIIHFIKPEAGTQSVKISTNNMAKGVYFAEYIYGANKSTPQKLVIH